MFVERTEKEGIVSCLFKSSNILSSDYNQEKKELMITFNAGRRYTYSNIENKDYIRFEIAESQGEVFSKHIKKYPTKRNDDVNPAELLNRVSQLITEQKNGTTIPKSS
jgi:hypothetical protein